MRYAEACDRLGLDPSIELDDSALKRAFKQQALRHHPDKNIGNADQAKEIFQQISHAYDFLCKCVARGRTGPNQPHPQWESQFGNDSDDDDDDDYYYDDDDDDSGAEYVDLRDILFSMFFREMAARSAGFSVPGMAGVRFHHANMNMRGQGQSAFYFPQQHPYARASSSRSYHNSSKDDDACLDDMMERMAEQARRKEEQRQKEKRAQQEHEKYMAERARQAELEGRDFFESWNGKQLKGECQRRGISCKNMLQSQMIQVLIADEAKKRLRQQLKAEAPLLDEWAEVIDVHRQDMLGLKVRVIDYYDDKYTVEWDTNAQKKGKKGHTRCSKKARLKNENLRLWGTGTPLATTSSTASAGTTTTSSSDKENAKQAKKSKSKTKKTAAGDGAEATSSIAAATMTAPTAAADTNDTAKATSLPPKATNTNTEKATPDPAKQQTTPAPKSVSVPARDPLQFTTTKCCVICQQEHDFRAKDGKNSKSMVVLPCAHIFCQDCCGGKFLPNETSTVQIRSCRVCDKYDPGLEALKTLPYILDLRDPSNDLLEIIYHEYAMINMVENVERVEEQHQTELEALKLQKIRATKVRKDAINRDRTIMKDKKGKAIKDMILSVEAEFEPRRKEILRKHELAWRSVAKNGTLEEMETARDDASEEAAKAINKHYRKASIKVHPDRHGDTFQAEFDALAKARDTLQDKDLRGKYLDQMLEIVCKVGTTWVKQSHESWVLKHQPGDAEKQRSTKKAEQYQKPLQLEGGLMHTTPRRPVVSVLNASEHRVRATLHIPGGSEYDFRLYCQTAFVFFERVDVYDPDGVEEEFHVAVRQDHLTYKLGSEIEIDFTLPCAGLWDIRWSFTTSVNPGEVNHSERSSDTRVDLVSQKQKSQLKSMENFENLAKRRTNDIHAALRKVASSEHSDAETMYATLQEAVLKARQTGFHLERAMEVCGVAASTANTPLAALRQALAATLPFKADLDMALELQEKRAALKSFKGKVIDMLENGEASSWLAKVAKQALENEWKGDPNRLYQLLMEGKTAFSVQLVDAAVLEAAVARTDLFTPKQLQGLSERVGEVEARAAEEARRVDEENELRDAEEKARRDLERRARLMERGTTVQIYGLKTQPELNGSIAIYMGVGAGERYNLRLHGDRDIALRKQNFRKWDGYGMAPPAAKRSPAKAGRTDESWACHSCTFLHDAPGAASMNACAMCGTQRFRNKITDTPSSIECPPNHPGGNKPGPAVRPEMTKPQQSCEMFPTTTGKIHGKQATKAGKDQKDTAVVKKEPPEAAKKPGRVPQQAKVAENASEDQGSKTQDIKPKAGKKRRCKYGKKCNRIKNCPFLHPDEEIAAGLAVKASTQKTNSHNGARNEERVVLIESGAVKLVIGKHGTIIRDICKTSGGAVIYIRDKEVDENGMVEVRIRGDNAEVLDKASALVLKRATTFSSAKDAVSTDTSSKISSLSVEHGAQASSGSVPSVISMPKDLLSFLRTQEKFLKVSSTTFFNRLHKEDIDTLSDLAEACSDDTFAAQLIQKGLKKFYWPKFRRTVKAAAEAAAST